MIAFPNAKINIGLNILEKRQDGYHNISSLFYPVDSIFDVLEIVPSNSFSFFSTGIQINSQENICIKAYNLLKSEFDIPSVKIHLHKTIPIGSGLGGGSSDGAFTLKVLNSLFHLGITIRKLEEYALRLGADCPFFIENIPKYVEGIGEKMTPIEIDLSKFNIRIVSPELHISTAEAYNNLKIDTKEINDLFESLKGPVESWKNVVKNDFEDSMSDNYPSLKLIKSKLYEDGAIYASMTGSGSSFYGVFRK